MRIIVTGLAVFVVWCFVSAWLYNDHLLPAIRKPVTQSAVPDKSTLEADSIAKLLESVPQPILIYFKFDDVAFSREVLKASDIEAFKTWLDKYPGSKVLVSGNTDLVGTPEFNYDLGLKRAKVVAAHLETLGIPAGRIIAESKGETDPAAGYITPEGRALNRRTVISIKHQ